MLLVMSRAQFYKTVYDLNLKMFIISQGVLSLTSLSSSLLFVSIAEAYLNEASSGVLLKGRLLALPTNIRLGRKVLLGTNTPALY